MKDSILLKKADSFVKGIYRVSRKFPKDEIYGLTSQLKRAALSIPLNIVEGFARQTKNENRRFLGMAYGSLKEVKYILYFAYGEEYLSRDEYENFITAAEEIGKILWVCISNLKSSC